MEFIGQTVPDRDTGETRKILYDPLAKTAIFDTVIHTAKNTRCIGNAFLFPDLASGRVQIGAVHTEVMGGDFKSTARTCACLFKDQGNIFSGKERMGFPGFFLCLKISGKVQKTGDLFRAQIE